MLYCMPHPRPLLKSPALLRYGRFAKTISGEERCTMYGEVLLTLARAML